MVGGPSPPRTIVWSAGSRLHPAALATAVTMANPTRRVRIHSDRSEHQKGKLAAKSRPERGPRYFRLPDRHVFRVAEIQHS